VIGITPPATAIIIAPMFHSFGFKAGLVVIAHPGGRKQYRIGTFGSVEKSLES